MFFFPIPLFLCLFTLIKPPTTAHTLLSFHPTTPLLISILPLMSVIMRTVSFLHSIMLIPIISFVTSVSISTFIAAPPL
ncbi:cation:proton antiporter, partial [Staphylococcus warneri]|uniref:cation:proton antiporter n=1 Tax=Staphylococcus warneri TaxID=1292 RepID=UPI0011A7CAD8